MKIVSVLDRDRTKEHIPSFVYTIFIKFMMSPIISPFIYKQKLCKYHSSVESVSDLFGAFTASKNTVSNNFIKSLSL